MINLKNNGQGANTKTKAGNAPLPQLPRPVAYVSGYGYVRCPSIVPVVRRGAK